MKLNIYCYFQVLSSSEVDKNAEYNNKTLSPERRFSIIPIG